MPRTMKAAVSPKAFAQATGMFGRHGTMSLVGLPPGDFPLHKFEVVLKRITTRGSIFCTRLDLAELLTYATENADETNFTWDKLDNINAVSDCMREGKIDGRVVLDIGET